MLGESPTEHTDDARAAARRAGPAIERLLLWATVAWAASTIWICPELPLVDLAQHAAQVTLFRDLLAGTSVWKGLVDVNLFTPYALEYGAGLLLSAVLPINLAFSVLLTLAYVGLVATCVRLRCDLGGEPRLDWLFIPTFFGYAWSWGFVPFLLAAPFGVWFLAAARRHAEEPDARTARRLLVLGAVLFFAHGLVFLVGLLGAGLFLFERRRLVRKLSRADIWPYLVLAALPIVYQLTQHVNAQIATLPSRPEWGDGVLGLYGRAKLFFVYPFGLTNEKSFTPIGVVFALAPLGLGARPNRGTFGWWVPFAAIALVYFGAPSSGFHFSHLYQRWALFAFPAYALLYRPPRRAAGPAPWRARATFVAMAVSSWAYLGVRTTRLVRFRREAAPIVARLEALPEGKRVLNLPFDPESPATGQEHLYQHFAVWYQAFRHGLVDVSFASETVQVVRYRPEALPKLAPSTELRPWRFDYVKNEGWIYDYILFRGRSAATVASIDAALHNPICAMQPLDAPAGWTLLERGACVTPPGRPP
jgi:hypothetical protein